MLGDAPNACANVKCGAQLKFWHPAAQLVYESQRVQRVLL